MLIKPIIQLKQYLPLDPSFPNSKNSLLRAGHRIAPESFTQQVNLPSKLSTYWTLYQALQFAGSESKSHGRAISQEVRVGALLLPGSWSQLPRLPGMDAIHPILA